MGETVGVGDATVGFRLGNGEALHRAAPRSFFIPGRAERDLLRAGDATKLLFEIVEPRPGMPTAERMWDSVTGRDHDGYTGALTNVPNDQGGTSRPGDTYLPPRPMQINTFGSPYPVAAEHARTRRTAA
jgi:hypothetical protein